MLIFGVSEGINPMTRPILKLIDMKESAEQKELRQKITVIVYMTAFMFGSKVVELILPFLMNLFSS
jgi:hypothetical protein